jgi:DNA-directed RNA polymerase subunit RPC12/RpoP
MLENFMLVSYPNFNPVKWQETIERQVKKAKKYSLIEIDFIPITKNELDTIKVINNKPQERLAFTLLCLAKFGNAVNLQNNDWTNREDKEIFRMANIQVSIKKQSAMMNSLRNKGLIQYSRIVDNLNTNVLFIDNESEVILEIEDFRNLGYEYALYCGEKFFKCENCGVLVRQNEKNNKKLCNECSKYQPMETKTIICQDCGKEITVDGIVKKQIRCPECQKKKQLEWQRNSMKKNRNQKM